MRHIILFFIEFIFGLYILSIISLYVIICGNIQNDQPMTRKEFFNNFANLTDWLVTLQILILAPKSLLDALVDEDLGINFKLRAWAPWVSDSKAMLYKLMDDERES